jgi:hypothetical protein
MMKASLGFPLAKVYSKRADHARNSFEIREARYSTHYAVFGLTPSPFLAALMAMVLPLQLREI